MSCNAGFLWTLECLGVSDGDEAPPTMSERHAWALWNTHSESETLPTRHHCCRWSTTSASTNQRECKRPCRLQEPPALLCTSCNRSLQSVCPSARLLVKRPAEFGKVQPPNICFNPFRTFREWTQENVMFLGYSRQEIWANAHGTRDSISLISYAGCLVSRQIYLSPVYFSENSL